MTESLRPTDDDRISAIAARQHGIVTRRQLLEAGLTSRMVEARVRSRRLQVLHRGVYLHGTLTGPLEPKHAREMAAVLACGPEAVVSHGSAALLWQLLRRNPDPSCVHVTIPGVDRGRRTGIHPHRVVSLPGEDVTLLDGLPLTTPARTIVDLATQVGARELEQAMAKARRTGIADFVDLEAVLVRGSRVRRAPLLRRLMEVQGNLAFTRSVAEEKMLELVEMGGLPTPETNVLVGESEVDFLWRSERVIAEVDGFAYHSSRREFENDRLRDGRLAAMGFRVVRVTWRQLTHEAHAVLVRLAQTLALAGGEV